MNTLRLGEDACLVILPESITDTSQDGVIEDTAPEAPGRKRTVLLDFTALRYLNGLGAGLLVKLSTIARKRGQRLLACGVSEHYRAVLKVTGLLKLITVVENRDRAFAMAGAGTAQIPVAGTVLAALDTGFWAKPVAAMEVSPVAGAINLNVRGRRPVGPVDGFGQLWQKRYRLPINKPGVAPADVIAALAQHFPEFQPDYNHFYPTEGGITPGAVVLIDSATPGGPVSTGVMVLYADDSSFTFITPEGHPESGWVTFSATGGSGAVTMQILGLARANDPVYEAAFRAVGSAMQVKIWTYFLTSLAAHFGVPSDISLEPVCVDKSLQWGQTGNVWQNAQIRTLLHTPLRWLGRGKGGGAAVC